MSGVCSVCWDTRTQNSPYSDGESGAAKSGLLQLASVVLEASVDGYQQ